MLFSLQEIVYNTGATERAPEKFTQSHEKSGNVFHLDTDACKTLGGRKDAVRICSLSPLTPSTEWKVLAEGTGLGKGPSLYDAVCVSGRC